MKHEAIIAAVLAALEHALGEGLESFYVYGSLQQKHYQPEQSDVNLLAVISDGTGLQPVREAFLPVWEAHRETLRRPPVVTPRSAFVRHLQLHPLLAHHLGKHGQRLAGRSIFAMEPDPPNPVEEVAYLSYQAMHASASLAPGLLPEHQTGPRRKALHRLARQLQQQPIAADSPAGELFMLIQAALRQRLAALPAGARPGDTPVITDPTHPNLEALYRETDRMVMVIPNLADNLLRDVDWERLAGRLHGRAGALNVTTATQLRISAPLETPVSLALDRYEHQWGATPLAGAETSQWALFRAAGRVPSTMQTTDVPRTYLTARVDEDLHDLVHTFQNRMLNLQLQHELMYRFGYMESVRPEEPLPERDQTLEQRVEGLLDHMGWWADYYAAQMRDAKAQA